MRGAYLFLLGAIAITLGVVRRLRAPLNVVDVTSDYGMRIVNGQEQWHNGIDLRAAVGTPVYAVASGHVTYGYNDRSGNYALLRRANGHVVGHAHLSTTSTDKSVKTGDIIGLTGHSGNARGAHLHFTYRVDGQTVNPRQFVQV